MATINLSDPTLFGNDNAEDEDVSLLKSYFFPRSEYIHIRDTQNPLAIVRAYKGEGKSALLRMLRLDLGQSNEHADDIIVECSAPTIAPILDSTDPTEWFQAWIQVLSRKLVGEIGASIGFATNDDSSLMVEEAIRQGTAARDFVSYVASRLKLKGQPAIEQKVKLGDPQALLRRWQKTAPAIWVLLDDIDFNYEDKLRDKCRIGQFLSACRYISTTIRNVRIRVSIRPNVWTSTRLRFEDLNKLEQYTRTIRWSEEDIRGLISHRISGYIERTIGKKLPIPVTENDENRLVELVFESPMAWGELRAPHIPLSTMSWRRPRWLVELCKEAAALAVRLGHTKILLKDLERVLPELGQRRYADMVAESRIRCPQVSHLIDAFAQGPARLDTSKLISFASKKLASIKPMIDGVHTKDEVEISSFLYEIGFLTARFDRPNGKYDHVRFAEYPTLLTSRGDIDQGHSWEIHPVFRRHLHLLA